MKSHVELWSAVLEELGDRCSVSTAKDLETVLGRFTHEGDKFFTITLPTFGKEFERALSLGYIPSDGFVGWKKAKRKTAPSSTPLYDTIGETPLFLGGFLDRVFDARSGCLLDTPSTEDKRSAADIVHAVRQLTLMFGKLKVLPDQEMIDAAFKEYVEIENQLTLHLQSILADGDLLEVVDELKKVVSCVFGDALSAVDKAVYEGNLTPRHGPGATADGLMGNRKFAQREWTDRLESLFPFVDYAIPNHRYHSMQSDVTWFSPEDERPSRLLAIPKTARNPRLIAKEPTCMQFMQQAVGRKFTECLESSPHKGVNLGASFVGFSEQWPNQAMAQIGSADGSLATLDLSEASDRVPNWLVEALFEDYPWFSEAISSTRSLRADVPGHGVIPLVKFASMGSALTFPIEAVVFATVTLWAIARAQGAPLSRSTFDQLRDKVRVYGDDIIVPTDHAVCVVLNLEYFGFKVNRNKSFWTGKFRESCGKEFYDGEDVSIVRYRKELPTLRSFGSPEWADYCQTTVETRNQFYMAGLWKSAALLDDILHTVLKGWYPYVTAESQVLGRISFLYGYEKFTPFWDADTQTFFVKGFVPYSELPKNVAEDEAALLKCLSRLPEGKGRFDDLFPPSVDEKHLTRSGRPRVAGIKLELASPF